MILLFFLFFLLLLLLLFFFFFSSRRRHTRYIGDWSSDVCSSDLLRALRIGQDLSLAEVAERTGLSTSFLSAVERGLSSISLGNLFKLADAYGTTVPGLNSEYRREQRNMLRPEDRPSFVAERGLVLIEDLIPRPGT